ncbi:hypothetical protein O0I10_000131 [Lichtheimia ornata]|uniref:Disease resistance R13L4/SHOC-2-like LRR domain-containing protein n=1 Tax=Lichtheimia ornata TaxID=688661 RepID=A0AAD8DJ93_9FUNG|nr:uncharacterized protein O0I10_000131 [Lichtheimia ornata]KAJ8663856.1 hypothetical protein O0I10_000131 [Lichtheimia ornata]
MSNDNQVEIKSRSRLQQLQLTSDPIDYLFSPTTLARDLSYVDKTYYNESRHTSQSLEYHEQATTQKNTPLTTTRMCKMLFHRTFHFISSVSHLELRNAGLHSLPTEITTLIRLSFLDLSHNRLSLLPSSIQQLKRLRHLNLAHNRLYHLPDVIGKLRRLMHLDVSHNGLREVPLAISELVHLKWLDVSRSGIDAIPAELLRLSKMTIKTEGCPRLQRRASRFQHPLLHDAPSLVEICARHLVKQNDNATPPIAVQQALPMRVTSYLSQQKPCSFCGQPYFGPPVVRYRITLHNDGHYIPIKYQMCVAHWSDDTDRILAFFSQPSSLLLHADHI